MILRPATADDWASVAWAFTAWTTPRGALPTAEACAIALCADSGAVIGLAGVFGVDDGDVPVLVFTLNPERASRGRVLFLLRGVLQQAFADGSSVQELQLFMPTNVDDVVDALRWAVDQTVRKEPSRITSGSAVTDGGVLRCHWVRR